jgi:hypothetical protein
MKTAMQELIEEIQYWKEKAPLGSAFKDCLIILEGSATNSLEKEKEQVIAAVRYGQNNYKENVYEEGELYYNEIYNSDAPFIKSSIPNGNIKLTKTNNL